jgi:hypothetical protein
VHKILDIDLDFFVWPPAHWPQWDGRMPTDQVDRVSRPDDVRRFLERQCHLSRGDTLPYRQVVEHDEAFWAWRQWIADGVIEIPFEVAHVDAHADLGLGDTGYVYLLSELLALPLADRSTPRRSLDGMNSGNFLAFAIANRWISKLTYVYPRVSDPRESGRTESALEAYVRSRPRPQVAPAASSEVPAPPVGDLMLLHLHQLDWRTERIELKQYPRDLLRSSRFWQDVAPGVEPVGPLSREPAVPFYLKADSVFSDHGFTHVTVAQSPQFTPATADDIIAR